jgi:hypothetical protein
VLAVYTGPGTDFATLKQVACDNDSGADGKTSRLQLSAKAGTIYFIVVDGVRGATGTAHLAYQLSAPSSLKADLFGNQFRLRALGPLGPNFTIQASTNLLHWTVVLTTNAPGSTLEWTDPGFRALPQQFYRAFRTE